MKFDIISIFPEFFDGPLSCGVVRIALEKRIIDVGIINPRDYTTDGVVDDYQFGGGGGMVLKPEPIVQAVTSIRTENSHIIHLTPQGERLNQGMVQELLLHQHIIMICGRYKGIDDRITTLLKPQEISCGDYVLSGGEIGALVLIEAMTRLLPGTLGNRDSAESDSFAQPLLEAPLYTRPSTYKKLTVPHTLRSGNHQLISQWRRKESLRKTLAQRPDVLPRETFSRDDVMLLLEVLDEENS